MVQTYQSPVRVYKYPFELVMAAYEKRFPTSPLIPVFIGSEITEEFKSDDGAIHVVERKCKLNVDAPFILKKIAGVDFIYFMQKNSLDKRKRTLNIEAHNLSFNTRVIVIENCFYYVHPENSNWTCFEQSASLDVKSFFGFESTVEKIAVKQYAANIQKGKETIEYYLSELISEGKSYIPPFEAEQSNESDSAISISRPKNSVSKSETESREEISDGQSTVRMRSRSGTMIRKFSCHLSPDDAEGKLEAEYIQRFLGALTPLEESRLCELRYSLHSNQKGKLPNDAHLLRFLRAREFDVGRAREMVTNSMMWRKQHNVDKILSSYQPPSVLLQFFPGAWHQHDLNGRPVFVLRLGQLDIKGLLRAVGEDGILKFVLSVCEEGLRRTTEATKNFGQPISTWSLLVDLEGLSMRHLWRPGIRTFLQIIEIAEANYPETMGCALIVRAPRVFPVLWTLISPFIDERTREKFMIYGGGDYIIGLRDYIDEKFIPEFLGGACFCLAPEGGHVPKTLYIENESNLSEKVDHPHQGLVLESLYQSGYVYKGLPLEVAIPVVTKGSVLTWDFDVVKGSCEFQILRVDKLIHVDDLPAQSSPSALSALSPTGLISSAGVGAAHSNTPLAFDRNLVLGLDVFIEEKLVTCCEGESIQGSHLCSRTGTYVLQWRYVSDASQVNAHHSTFDFSLPMSHKCKLMYHHQLLDSENFKGSMASLQSCRSSFSSLSNTTVSSQKSTDVTPVLKKKESGV
jgi:hypothetical protein